MKGFFFGFAAKQVLVLERSLVDTIDRPVSGFALFRRVAFFTQCWCEVGRAFFRFRSRFFGKNTLPRAGAARGGKYPFLSRRIFPRGFFFIVAVLAPPAAENILFYQGGFLDRFRPSRWIPQPLLAPFAAKYPLFSRGYFFGKFRGFSVNSGGFFFLFTFKILITRFSISPVSSLFSSSIKSIYFQ